MIRRTLAQVRPELTRVAGTTGMSVTDSRFIPRLNKLQQELMDAGDWPNVVDRWHIEFDETTGELVLPYFLERLMQFAVDDCPGELRSPWYELVAYGPGPNYDERRLRNCWSNVAVDRGEVCSRVLIPSADGPWVIRCYASVDEDVDGVPPQINLQGTDPDKKLIRSLVSSAWVNGVFLDIDFGVAFTVTTQEFGDLKAVVKPETNGYVRITAWNGTDEVELSDYAPPETNPSYRKYYLPTLYRANADATVRVLRARCRKRYFPVAEDDDELIISNLPALECMMMAQWRREAGNLDEYAKLKLTAIDLLQKEALAYMGKARVPAISFQRGFPLGSMPTVR